MGITNSSAVDCHDPIVSIENVSFAYENKRVITHLNFSILQRDFVCLIGMNGAGKTTLLKMIVGLLKPQEGEIRLFGQPSTEFQQWNRIGYVPQKQSFNPLFPATVREVVMSGLYSKQNMFHTINKRHQQKCDDALRALGIADLASNRIGQLSGGQQQRVLLARSLVNNPELLILDEPTVGIDVETQQNFFRLIQHLHKHHPITFLIVTHDFELLQPLFGSSPGLTNGKLMFYVKHTHDPEDCVETNLAHALSEFQHTEPLHS